VEQEKVEHTADTLLKTGTVYQMTSIQVN